MKKLPREDLAFYIFLLVLFLCVGALSVFLLGGERKRGELLVEYETEKIATALMESFRESQQLDLESVREQVLGFGIYDGEGQALERVGTAPERLGLAQLEHLEGPLRFGLREEPSFRFHRQAGSLVLMRRIGMPGMMGMPWGMRRGMQDRMPRMRFPNAPQLLYLELSVGRHWARQRLFGFAQVLVPLFLLGTVMLVGFLYRRNSEYRRRLQAQEQLARLGEASRTLSHEIKNPLSAIRIQTGILKKTLPEISRGDLRIIEEEIARLALLTDRVGDFLRDPLGAPELIDLDAFMKELILRYDRRIRYRYEGTGPAKVRFDPQRLRSVLENLINNALESMEGKEAEVEVACSAERDRATVRVLDRGQGIPAEIREKVFDPFFTSKTKGSGIGLAVAKRFVEAAGGTLALSDRKGGGTEARIELPREAL